MHWDTGFWTLMVATFVLATTHSVNPDHWFPFVMVGRAKRWKTAWVLALACLAGIGHVGTSAIIGLVGVFAKKGTAKEIADFLESATPLLLMIFGFGYAAYYLYQHRIGSHGHSHGLPFINKWLGIDSHAYALPGHDHAHDHPHDHHAHSHTDPEDHRKGLKIGKVSLYLHNMDLHIRVEHADHSHNYDTTKEKNHLHEHAHGTTAHRHEHLHHECGKHAQSHEDHEHGKPKTDLRDKRAGWGLVAILGLTPCIALLPLTFAAVKYGTTAIILVNINFALATIGTIVLFTWLGVMGLSWIKLEFFDEYGDIIAGLIIGLVGVATKVFTL